MQEFFNDDSGFSYELLHDRLAVESISSPNMLELFKAFLPKTVNVVKELIPSVSSFINFGGKDDHYLNADRRKLLKLCEEFSYSAYSDMLITVPENFKGKLVPYFMVLLEQGKEVAQEGKRIVADFNIELAKYLSDADIRSSMSSNENYYKLVRSKRESYAKAISVFFGKTDSSRARLGDCIERFADLVEVFQLEDKLHNTKKQQDFKSIVIEVQKCTDLLSLIQRRIEAGEFDKMSAQMAKNIAKGSYEVAKYVEYLANYGYMLEVALGTTHNLYNQLFETFNKK